MSRAIGSAMRRHWMVLLFLLALTPSSAHAAVGAGMTMSFPLSVSEGQTGLPAWIALHNLNTTPDTTLTNGVCNAGDVSPPCSPGEPGITVIPSCKQIVSGLCTAAGADPGVLTISPAATGRAGSSCAGMTFATSIVDETFGTVLFTPAARAHVSLPSDDPICTIDFTVSVAKAPSGDVNGQAAGTQVGQTARHTQWLGAFESTATRAGAIAALDGTTVLPPATPTPPCTDCDDDGYLAKVDCADGNANIHPAAFDTPANRVDEDCDGRDGTFPPIGSSVSFSYEAFPRYTRFESLVLRQARSGTTVRIRCTGGGCGFASRTRRINRNHTRVELSAIVRRSRLRPRSKLEISVTRAGTIGLRRTFTVRAGKAPIQVDRCLVPGQTKTSACTL